MPPAPRARSMTYRPARAADSRSVECTGSASNRAGGERLKYLSAVEGAIGEWPDDHWRVLFDLDRDSRAESSCCCTTTALALLGEGADQDHESHFWMAASFQECQFLV